MSLAEQIRAIQRRRGGGVAPPPGVGSGATHEEDGRFLVASDIAEVDAALGGGLTRGALHEWLGVGQSAVGTKARRHDTWTPPLLPLVHLVRRTLAEEGTKATPERARRGGDSFLCHVVWIGRRCFPYGGSLYGMNGDRRLLERSLFVVADRVNDRLWAVDLALRCPAVGVVVADGSGFDMAGTRRIQLVAKAHRTPALLARPPWEVRELSAAQTRWLVRWDAAAGTVDDESNVLNPRWSVELLRCKGGPPECRSYVWAMEWDRDQGALRVLAPLAGAIGDAGASTAKRRLRQA